MTDNIGLNLKIQELASEIVDRLMRENPEMDEEFAWEIAMEKAESEIMSRYKE